MSALSPDETILGLLAAQAQHGYQLLDAFSDPAQLGSVWKLSTSQLYNVLKRLEREGWIYGAEQVSDNAPPRIEYALTDAGWSVLRAWLGEPQPSASVRRIRVEFLSRLYVATRLAYPSLPIIERQRAACHAELDRLQAAGTEGMGTLAAEFVIAQLHAVLGWIDRCALSINSPQT